MLQDRGEDVSASRTKDEFSEIPWDRFSEQPYPIRHRRGLRARIRYAYGDYLKTALLAFFILPLVAITQFGMTMGYRPARWARPRGDSRDFVGIAVALQSCEGPELAAEIKELGVKQVLLRIPVWEIESIDKYVSFIESLPDCEVAVCVMQSRSDVTDLERWRLNLRTIVRSCWPRVRDFQIGQGANRSKWGFFSTAEYLGFASVAEELREDFEGIRLVGPGILDFETMPLLRSLAHGFPIKWDTVGCALYVDRRGSPKNRQLLLFNVRQKILHFASCIRLATKAKPRFWITEVNWPLANQGPYSPTCERDCVCEESAARYLSEYYEEAWKTGLVERVYWWQLVAKGFGLMDVDEKGALRKRPAYFAFKRLIDEGVSGMHGREPAEISEPSEDVRESVSA